LCAVIEYVIIGHRAQGIEYVIIGHRAQGMIEEDKHILMHNGTKYRNNNNAE